MYIVEIEWVEWVECESGDRAIVRSMLVRGEKMNRVGLSQNLYNVLL